ncbi:MAG: NUDIX domain-containing protein [Candidatus Vogelbacteria bacterium]|nr:NUDIX domain-containing protein [Candidatus Vogelbacteria bacterium]
METKPGLGRAVLAFFVKNGQVLLALKKQKIGAGLLNGYGGEIEKGETPTAAIIREVRQECGVKLILNSLIERGMIRFHNPKPGGKVFVCEVCMFVVTDWQGSPKESDEMGKPEWFPIDDLPFSKMMVADKLWLPYVLDLKKEGQLEGDVCYSPEQKKVENHVLLTR